MADWQPQHLETERVKNGGAVGSAPSWGGSSDWARLEVKHSFCIIKSWCLLSSKSGSLHFALFYSQKKLQFTVWMTTQFLYFFTSLQYHIYYKVFMYMWIYFWILFYYTYTTWLSFHRYNVLIMFFQYYLTSLTSVFPHNFQNQNIYIYTHKQLLRLL